MTTSEELRRTEGRDAHSQRVGRQVIPDDPSIESPHFDGVQLASKSKSSASATFSTIMVVVAPVSISAWQVLVEFASVGSGPTFAGECGRGSLGVLDRLALTTLRGRCAGGESARVHDRDRKRVSGEVPRAEAFLPRLDSRRVVVEGLNDHAVNHEHGACPVLGDQIIRCRRQRGGGGYGRRYVDRWTWGAVEGSP